jgi:hypothetical protein
MFAKVALSPGSSGSRNRATKWSKHSRFPQYRPRSSARTFFRVMEFLVETYVSRSQSTGEILTSAAVSSAAEQITREGRPVHLVRSIVVPEEETCFFLFQAQSADAVRDAATRAGLRFGRVLETMPEWISDIEPLRTDPISEPATPSQPIEREQS